MAITISDAEEAFDEALNSAEEAKGVREKATFRGQEIDVLIGQQEIDPDYTGSGVTQNAPWQVSLRKREVKLPLRLNESITIRNIALKVLSYKPLAGRIAIIAGDPSKEVQ